MTYLGHTDKVSVWSNIIGVPVPGGSRGPESEAFMVLGYQYYISAKIKTIMYDIN